MERRYQDNEERARGQVTRFTINATDLSKDAAREALAKSTLNRRRAALS
jgi:hypothetical protein